VSRARHLVLVGVAALPLLVLVLVVVGQSDARVVVSAVALWLVGVAVLAGVVWRETIRPLAEVVHELDAQSAQHARWRVREVKDRLARNKGERDELTQLLEDVAEGLGEGLLVVGPDLRVRLVNSKALHFLGADRLAAGSHLLDRLRAPDAVEAVRTAAAGEPARRVMVENPRGMWEVHAFPIRSHGAVVLITEVGLLRRAAELRRRFVQDLSHELRSPLAVMRTTVEAMEGEVAPQLADMMIRQVARITRLTDELYELATIEAGAVDLKPEPQVLRPLVAEILADFASVADQAGVELRMSLPAELSCSSTGAGSTGCSATWSTTPSSTTAPAAGSRSGAGCPTPGSASRSRTAASGSRPRSSARSCNASTASTRPGHPARAAWVWASPSSSTWCCKWGATWCSTPARAWAPSRS
jgi:signal transduction histidine kinase